MSIYLDSSEIYKNNTYLPILIKGDTIAIKNLSKGRNTSCKWCIENICALNFHLKEIEDFLLEKGVWQMEFRWAKAQKLELPDDSLHLQHNNITAAHLGQTPLLQNYDGSGVLLGIIDDGFELEHPDFLHPEDNSSRVLFLWDQTSDYNLPTHHLGYGSIWTKNDIDNNICRQIPKAHGTHVAAIAAGNAKATGKFIGVAPKADLLFVKINENSGAFLAEFVDAVYWLYEKSIALNQPLAINSSVGVYGGTRDGKDLYAQAIAAILNSRNGIALAQATGNARTAKMQVRNYFQSAQDTFITAFDYHLDAQRTHFFIYADTIDFANVNFLLQAADNAENTILHSSQVFNIKRDFPTPNNTTARYRHTFIPNQVDLDIRIANYNGVYEIWVQILQINTALNNSYWQIKSFGTGLFDIYASQSYLGTSNIKDNLAIRHYNAPEQKQNIVGYWTCANEVIAVSAYQNQTYMLNYLGDSVYLGTNGFPQGGIAPFSSIGLTRDGRQKPDIAASGGQVIAAATLSDIDYYKRVNYTYLHEDGWHVSNRGTSMAAPFVAGALALYFQLKPQANNNTIRQDLYASAKLDAYVFMQENYVPNAHWGYGKLDVFALLKNALILGCTDSIASNYNPLANADDGTCFTVNIDKNTKANNFVIYPNPAYKSTIFSYEIPQSYTNALAFVYNIQGQLLGHFLMEDWQGNFDLNQLAIQGHQVLYIQIIKANLPPLYYSNLLLLE